MKRKGERVEGGGVEKKDKERRTKIRKKGGREGDKRGNGIERRDIQREAKVSLEEKMNRKRKNEETEVR